MRILVVEDEAKTAKFLQKGLGEAGFVVDVAGNGLDGLHLAQELEFDLLILDVMLPGLDGWQVLSRLREEGRRALVLFLTARDAVHERVRGFDLGADDYLVKPFAFPELSARVRALLRRGKPEAPVSLQVEDLHIDLISRTVKRGSQILDLTGREYEVLEYLLRHHGQVVSREMLARDVWKETVRHSPLDNVIDVHMVRIRRKVDEGFATKLVHTVRGVGFVLKKDLL